MSDRLAEPLPTILRSSPLTGFCCCRRSAAAQHFRAALSGMTRDALCGERLIGMVQPSDPSASDSNPPSVSDRLRRRITSFFRDRDGRF